MKEPNILIYFFFPLIDDAYIGGRSTNNIKCVVHDDLGERTEQLDIFCRVTGFTSDFLSFIDVELIRFFHGALQLITAVNGLVCDRLTAA